MKMISFNSFTSVKSMPLVNTKTIVFTVIMLFLNLSVFAQDSYEYVGALKLNDSTAIPYKIYFEENEGKVSGYSITDISGEHETKSSIKGEYDEDDKTLSFHETGIVYTKSTFVENDFCFIHLEPTKFKLGRTKSFKADFLGKFSDGTKCINGEIFLNAFERVEKVVKKLSKKVNRSRKIEDSLKQKFNNVSIMDSLKLNVLKREETTTFFTKSNTIELSIFDAKIIDDDIISVMVNEEYLLDSHVATREKKILKIKLDKKKTNIVLISESIGKLGVNTTMIELKDSNDNRIEAITKLKKGEVTKINVIKL